MRTEIAALARSALAGVVVVSPIFHRCHDAIGVGHEQGFWAQQWPGLQRMFNLAR